MVADGDGSGDGVVVAPLVGSLLDVGAGLGAVVGAVVGVVVGAGVGAGVVLGAGVGLDVGSGSGLVAVDGGVLDPTVAGPEVPGPQFRVLLELLELDELVTVPCPSSVVTGVDGLPPDETRTQFDELGELVVVGVKVTPAATDTARRMACCTAGLESAGAAVSPTASEVTLMGRPLGTAGPTSGATTAAGWEIRVFAGKFTAFAGSTVKIEANAIAMAATTASTQVRGVGFMGGLARVRQGALYPESASLRRRGRSHTIPARERHARGFGQSLPTRNRSVDRRRRPPLGRRS